LNTQKNSFILFGTGNEKMVRKVLVIITMLIVLIIGVFSVWAYTPTPPMAEAQQALQSNAQVSVRKTNGWLVFSPVDSTPGTGLILYPGSRVDYRAYAPEAQAISAGGYLVVIVPMPFNLAIFG
jgi:hypothetical protein